VLALLLVALGTAAAWTLLTVSATEFAAGVIGRLLGRRVEIATVEVRLGATLEIELHGLRVLAEDDSPTFEAPVARFHQSWARLLAGRILPLAWTFERPVLRVRRGVGVSRRLESFPPLELSVLDGTVFVDVGAGPPIRIERLRVSAQQAPLRAGVRGSALGSLARGRASIGSFAADFEGWLGSAELRGRVEKLALSELPLPVVPRAGVASGDVSLAIEEDESSGALDLGVRGLRIDIPEATGPLAPAEARLAADFQLRAGALSARLRPLALDDFVLTGDVSIGAGPDGRVRATLAAAPFEVRPGTRLQPVRILALRFRTFADLDARTQQGRVEELRASLDLARAALAPALALERVTAPEELQLYARVADAVYRARPDVAPIEDLSGEFHWEGDRMRFADVRMRREGRWLPRIDVAIDGARLFTHLPPEERKIPEGPGLPIPGLGAAFASFERDPDSTEPPLVIDVRDAYVGYPGFLLPFRDGEIRLRFPDGNLLVERADGILGGRPATVHALWDRGADRIDVQVAYREGEAPPRRDPGPAWASGDLAIERVRLGRWPLESLRAKLRAERGRAHFTDVEARLAGGEVRASGHVSIAEEGAAPLEFDLRVAEADASRVGEILEFGPDAFAGTVDAQGTLSGRLVPGRDFARESVAVLRLGARDGTVANLPLLLAVARLASPLGWTGLFGRPLPYETVTADLRIDRGTLRTENFALDGPELRMLAAGEIDVVEDAHPVDLVIALLFLRTVDQVLERVPFVGSWILGENRSLVTLYFKVNGPWRDPRGVPLPPGGITTAAGWAGRVIGQGVRRVRDMLVAPGAPVPPPPVDGADTPKGDLRDGAWRPREDPRS
jgi:hypothetical protein